MQKLVAERELHLCVTPLPKGNTERAQPFNEGEMKGARASDRSYLSEERNFSRQAHQNMMFAYHDHVIPLLLTLANSIQPYSSSAINMVQRQSNTM